MDRSMNIYATGDKEVSQGTTLVNNDDNITYVSPQRFYVCIYLFASKVVDYILACALKHPA